MVHLRSHNLGSRPSSGSGCYGRHLAAGLGTAPADVGALPKDRLHVALVCGGHALAPGRTRLTNVRADAARLDMKRGMPTHELRIEEAHIGAVPTELNASAHAPHVH